jgi:hypothetical protein
MGNLVWFMRERSYKGDNINREDPLGGYSWEYVTGVYVENHLNYD